MTITEEVTKNIIKLLLKGEDYRVEVTRLIDEEFLQFAIEFFKKVAEAKLNSKDITVDWYKQAFLDPTLPPKEIAINSGLNTKTIRNMHGSATKKIVIDASNKHFDLLCESIKDLVNNENELELALTIKFKGVSVDLNVSESLIVMNVLAVKRAELRGGLWSTAGKRVEKPLMQVLCKLYQVPKDNYSIKINDDEATNVGFQREVDFYLNSQSQTYKCEVKLMGRGNPESADTVIARESKVFIADTLSETNKNQLDNRDVQWVELRAQHGFKRFSDVLTNLNIPYSPLREYKEEILDGIFNDIFS